MGVLAIKNNIIKYYGFTENIDDGKTKKFFEILLLPILVLVLYLFFRVLILDKIIVNTMILESVSKLFLLVLFVVIVGAYIIYSKTLKGIFIYNDHIQIVYAITKRNLLNVKPKIKYSEITKCEKISNSFDNKMKYNISLNYIAGVGDEYIMIETVNEKIFFFCVENQDEFIRDIKTRIPIKF